MTERPLAGKRIAVLVETEFVSVELAVYERILGSLGAQVDFLANVRPNRRIHIVSDVDGVVYQDPRGGPDHSEVDLEATRRRLEVREVTGDISEQLTRVADYSAVLVAANYTSVRLRYFDSGGHPVAPDMVRTAPAVRFVARALRTPGVVVGALCHGLWMFTPIPDLLAGRRVVCHEVVLADVLNAGASYVAPRPADMGRDFSGWTPGQSMPSTVVVDHNLVTGRSVHDAVPYVHAVANRMNELAREATDPRPLPPRLTHRSVIKRILVVLSEYGYWGEELIGPVDVFDRQGYEVRFATPMGRRPRALPPSMSAEYIDPPLARCVTTSEMAARVREWDDVSDGRRENSRRLDSPISLRDRIPTRPYYASAQLVRGLERYYADLDREVVPELVTPFDCLLIVGGSGPIVDLVNNERVHDLILAFYRAGKPIAAECYGVACLAFARDPEFRVSIIQGKRVTGHCLEYDYKDGTGFLDPNTAGQMEAGFVPFNMGPPPYPLEFILRDATRPDGAYIGNFGKETSVIVDYPFITGRSTPDSTLTGEKVVEVLENGLRRFGW